MEEVMFQSYLNEKGELVCHRARMEKGSPPCGGRHNHRLILETKLICRYDFTAAAQGWVGLGRYLSVWVMH